MHNHDHDLIMALAEGSVPASDVSRMERELVACDECRADLEAQRAALAFLREAPAVRMTSGERSVLHERLRQELHLEEAPAPPVAERPRRRLPWAALGTAAAVLVGLLAVAPTLTFLGSGTDDSAGDAAATTIVASAEAATTTTADTDLAAALGGQVQGLDNTATAEDFAPGAPGETWSRYYDAGEPLPMRTVLPDLDELRRLVAELEEPEQIRREVAEGRSAGDHDARIDACIDLARDRSSTTASAFAIMLVDDEQHGLLVVVALLPSVPGDPEVVALALDDCSVVAQAG